MILSSQKTGLTYLIKVHHGAFDPFFRRSSKLVVENTFHSNRHKWHLDCEVRGKEVSKGWRISLWVEVIWMEKIVEQLLPLIFGSTMPWNIQGFSGTSSHWATYLLLFFFHVSRQISVRDDLGWLHTGI